VAVSTGIPEGAFLIFVIEYAVMNGIFLVSSVRRGSWLGAAAAALLASPVPICILAAVMEHRSLVELVMHFQDQSYAFMFGDTFGLSFAAAMAALAWRRSPALRRTWATSWWWSALSVMVGLLTAYWFRYLNDQPRYYKVGAIGSFHAPTKLFHDFGTYPMLFGGLFCVCVPLFLKAVNLRTPFVHFYAAPGLWPALTGIGLWYAAGLLHDAGLFGALLDPRKLHPDSWKWPT